MISYQDFTRLLTDTTEFTTFDAYVADCGGSVDESDLPTVISALEIIWELGHDGLSIGNILQTSSASMADLSREYKIPYRTVQNWACGDRTPPEWQLPLLAYAVFSDLMEG